MPGMDRGDLVLQSETEMASNRWVVVEIWKGEWGCGAVGQIREERSIASQRRVEPGRMRARWKAMDEYSRMQKRSRDYVPPLWRYE